MRVEDFAIFEKIVLAITSRILRVLMECIENICGLESKLFLSLYDPLETLI